MIKRLLYLTLATVAFSATVHAGDIIRATVVITNASNFNGSPVASLTVNSDTRTWTNSVTTSTEIKSSTNIATAAFNLLQHIRSYPFTDVQLQATNNGIVLTGTEGAALSLVVSNDWASVDYRTNTVGTSYGVVRIPYTIENATTQARISDGLVDYLNEAQTNAIDQTAPVAAELVGLGNTQTITGAKIHNNSGNIFSGKYLQLAHAALAVDSAGTNFVVDFTGEAYRSITATNDVNFIHSTNRAAVLSTVVFIYPNGSDRSLTVNASWHAVGSAAHSVVTNNTIGILSLTCATGTTETNVFYSYAVTQ